MAPSTPIAGRAVEDTGTACVAVLAMAGIIQAPIDEFVPVAGDEYLATAVTIGAAAGEIVNVTGVYITQTIVDGDTP